MALTCERSISLFRSIDDKWGLSYALNYMGSILNHDGSFDAASKHLQEGLRIVKALNDETSIGVISLELGAGAMKQGKYDLAETPLRASIHSATRSGDKWVTAFALRDLGALLQHTHNFETAGECYSSALDLFQELGANQLVATVILSQGILAQKRRDESEAARLYLESLALAGSLHIRSVAARCYIQFASLALAHGQHDRAAVLIGAADSAYPILYNWLLPFEREDYDRLVGTLRARLGSSSFSRSRLAGRHFLPAQAFAEVETLASTFKSVSARSSKPQAISRAPYPAGLTKREVELLRLLDVGLSNAAIAARLLLSSNTVRAHLSSVYSKLNVTSRSAAAHFAREHGLI
jgi:DNA-binding CsgD family transcriptional regulator